MATKKTSSSTSLRRVDPAQEFDFRSGKPMPAALREAIEAHLAIDAEDAKSAGSLGFMTRAFTLATMPYKDPKSDAFTRVNGNFKLRIVAGYEGGIPFGIYPRLLMNWVATEAVVNQSPVLELGHSLSYFLQEIMEVRSTGGGSRGAATRVTEQMKRLFGSMISAETKSEGKGTYRMKNVMIASDLELDDEEARRLDSGDVIDADESSSSTGLQLWTPQKREDAGQWKSKVQLSETFFRECVERPVPVDLRAYKALRSSPLAMDVYTWLTYRMSYTTTKTRPIPWLSLMNQFGSNYNSPDMGQNVRNFKKAFLQALNLALVVYPTAKVLVDDNAGLVLLPSPTHVLPKPQKKGQQGLGF